MVHSRQVVPASVSVEVTRACKDVNEFFNGEPYYNVFLYIKFESLLDITKNGDKTNGC